jgi:hypothetical protein
MSLKRVLSVLIVLVAVAVGAFLIRTEFGGHSTGMNPPGTSDSGSGKIAVEQQQRAEQQNEQDTIKANCAALRKMGAVNKNCLPQ